MNIGGVDLISGLVAVVLLVILIMILVDSVRKLRFGIWDLGLGLKI
jgi:uncharacterized integral membrane protein